MTATTREKTRLTANGEYAMTKLPVGNVEVVFRATLKSVVLELIVKR